MAFSRIFRRFRAPQSQTWRGENWVGQYDTHGTELSPHEVPMLINFFPLDPARGGPLAVRPGRITSNSAAAPRAGLAAHLVQGVFDTSPITGPLWGDPLTIVCDGEIYTLDLGGGLNKRVTAANLTTAVITLSSTTSVNACLFNGKIVFTDHLNTAFTWNGTAGAGGLVKLTAAGSAVRNPTAYYAKLFFIKSDKKTLIWSEENQENTGYEAGGFNNSWTLSQTSQDPLTGLYGTNEALYYARTESIGAIRGAVTSTFATDGVNDGVHLGSGAAARTYDVTNFRYLAGSLFWIDEGGLVWAYRPGSGSTCLSQQMPRLAGSGSLSFHITNTNTQPLYGVGEDILGSLQPIALVCDAKAERLYVLSGTSELWIHVFDANTYRLLATWDFGPLNPPRSIATSSGVQSAEVYTYGQFTQLIYVDTSGYVFAIRLSSLAQLIPTCDMTETGTATAVRATFVGPMHGWDSNIEYRFTRLNVHILEGGTNQVVTAGYLTSQKHKVALAPPQSITPTINTTTPWELRLSFGLHATGRWCRPVITVDGNTNLINSEVNPVQLVAYELTGVTTASGPTGIR